MPHEVKIGQLIENPNQCRDAIHFACAPVVAAEGEKLLPGQDIGFIDGSSTEVSSGAKTLLGIVDPFLRRPVYQREHCWMLLYPNTITSLRHDWEHPAFEPQATKVATPSKEESEAWLRAFVERSDCPDYETLMAAATGRQLPNPDDEWYDYAYRNDGEYLHFNGIDAHSDIPPEFWDHVEVVSGEKVPGHKRATSFSCSC